MKLDLRNIKIIYINLDEQVEKRKRTEALLSKMGFKDVRRFSAIKHEKGRIVGCARSHYEVLNLYNPPFIIIEDDCEVNREFDGIIEAPLMADAIYLGISHWGRYLNHSGPFVHVGDKIGECLRIYNMLSTHAILYLEQSYVDICKNISFYYGYNIENHVDIGFAENQKYFQVYALDDPLFKQYEWSPITTGKLSENSINEDVASQFYYSVISDDQNFYKMNNEVKSPFRPLISKRDVTGFPGYFVPTKLI